MKPLKRQLKIKTLNGQLILRIFIVLFIVLIVIEITQYFIIKQYLFNSKEELLQSRLHNVEIEMYASTDTPQLLKERAPDFISKLLDLNVAVTLIDDKGVAFAGADEGQLAAYQEHLLKNDKELLIQNNEVPYLTKEKYQDFLASDDLFDSQIQKNDSGESFMILNSKVGKPHEPSGLIQLSTSITSIYETLNRQLLEYCLISLAILLLGLILLSQVIRWSLKPLNSMKGAVETISLWELDKRLREDQGQEEIDQLSKAYNEMLVRIEKSFSHEMEIKDRMRQFISDASHELRTPLTSIHGFAEILLMGAAKDEEQLNLALNTILMESDRLTLLVNDLLALSKLDQNDPVEMVRENLRDIIEEITPQIALMAKTRKIEIEFTDQDLWMNCNRNQIKQVILNLVHNGIQFTDGETGVIRIEAHKEKNQKIVLSISDNGVGISPEAKDKIFDRFYRAQESRSRETGGYGLGLSIVKGIMACHEAEIWIGSTLREGTTFVLAFGGE